MAGHAQSVILWRAQEPQRGSTWREEMKIESEGVKLVLGTGGQNMDGSGSLQFLETIERTHTGVNRQDAEVLASTLVGSLFILGQNVDQLQGGPLLGHKLEGKRERNAWQFGFKDVNPSAEGQVAREALGKRTDLLAFWPVFYGAQARRKGETWKADTSTLLKDPKPDSPLVIDLDFTLLDVAEHAGSRCAKLGVNGFLKLALVKPHQLNIILEVQGEIWREPRAMVDLDMNLKGALKISGAAADKDPNVPAGSKVDITAPITLTRSVRQVKR